MRSTLRLLVLAAAMLLCAASAVQQQPAQQPAAGGGGQTMGGGGSDPTGCTDACLHYLQCKGSQDQAVFGQCVSDCRQMGANPADLFAYAQTDCATAIQIVEGGGGGGMQGGQQGACTADCTGCVWDGTSCYYHATAVGAGSVSYCDACCCAPGGPAQRWD